MMKNALVVATDHDGVTSILRSSFEPLPVLLQAYGFSVTTCFSWEATDKKVYTKSFEVIVQSGQRFVLGVFGAHGSEMGVHDSKGNLLLSIDSCSHFRDAILILCSCLKSGEFPAKAIKIRQNGSECVKAVICYEPKLRILPKKFLRRVLKEQEKSVLNAIIALHVEKIAASHTVAETVKTVKDAWWTCLKELKSGDIHIGMNWIRNRDALTWHGIPTARI